MFQYPGSPIPADVAQYALQCSDQLHLTMVPSLPATHVSPSWRCCLTARTWLDAKLAILCHICEVRTSGGSWFRLRGRMHATHVGHTLHPFKHQPLAIMLALYRCAMRCQPNHACQVCAVTFQSPMARAHSSRVTRLTHVLAMPATCGTPSSLFARVRNHTTFTHVLRCFVERVKNGLIDCVINWMVWAWGTFMGM